MSNDYDDEDDLEDELKEEEALLEEGLSIGEDEDEDDSMIFDEEEDELYEEGDEDEEEEDDLEDDDDDDRFDWSDEDDEEEEEEEEYDGPIPETEEGCFLCDSKNVPESDKWKYDVVDENNESYRYWLCRHCHGMFGSVEEFEEFRTNFPYTRIYRAAARLQRLLLLKAPKSVIASEVLGGILSAMFYSDEMGGSEELREAARKELEGKAKRYLSDRKD
jgi:hypothetical protein